MRHLTLNHIRFALVTLQDVIATALQLVERGAERWETQRSGLYSVVASAEEAQDLFNQAAESVVKDALYPVPQERASGALQEKEDEPVEMMSMAEMSSRMANANLPLPMTLQSVGAPS